MPARRGDAARRRLTAAVADAGAMPALQPGGVRTPSVRASCVRVASAWSKAGSGYARLQHPGFGLRPFGASWVRVPSVCSILGSRSVRLQRSGGCLRSPAAIRVLFSIRPGQPGFGFRPSMLEKTMWVRVLSIWRLKMAPDGRNTNPTSANGRKSNPRCPHAAHVACKQARCMQAAHVVCI